MNNREKSAKMLRGKVDLFRCPICHQTMNVVEAKSLVCVNRHTFDFAKQGYVNMLHRPSPQQYDRELFEARRRIIVEGELYSSLHKEIAVEIGKCMGKHRNATVLFDAGCGEGSHLQILLDECRDRDITGIGLDISKEGIMMASRKYCDSIWLVGDLANIPLADHSCHIILNILSPANYAEFNRILTNEGIVVKIAPRPQYLKEVREAVFGGTDREKYVNDKTISLFRRNFRLIGGFGFKCLVELMREEIFDLIQMSPLSWSAQKEQIDEFIDRDSIVVTVDLDVLIGAKTA